MIRLGMKSCTTILTEKYQKLPSGKFDKYEYLTGEEILPSDQRRVIEQAKFNYSSIRKVL